MIYDYAIVGGGIVGLATAVALVQRSPGCSVLVLERESRIATHQTGRNSGVIHSGIYYKPGSLKARLAREGSQSIVEFCREHGIAHEICGKLIVATEPHELPLLENLLQRGLQNQLGVTKVSPEEARELEPHVRCLSGIKVPTTGIVDYKEVCNKLAELVVRRDGKVTTGTMVIGFRQLPTGWIIQTELGDLETRFLVNCAGLQSDRIARLAGLTPEARIVPFRGEYYELVPEKCRLVRGLIYPVPNPDFPFLGVHFTRSIDGSVHAGPNAVLALKREGYQKTDFSPQDTFETLTYPGFWRLARKHFREGVSEVWRSVSKAAFVRSLQRLIPEVQSEDLVPAPAGVRAQALLPGGQMVDDFLILSDKNALHVCNAPSPAATASLEIGKHIAERAPCFSPVQVSLARS